MCSHGMQQLMLILLNHSTYLTLSFLVRFKLILFRVSFFMLPVLIYQFTWDIGIVHIFLKQFYITMYIWYWKIEMSGLMWKRIPVIIFLFSNHYCNTSMAKSLLFLRNRYRNNDIRFLLLNYNSSSSNIKFQKYASREIAIMAVSSRHISRSSYQTRLTMNWLDNEWLKSYNKWVEWDVCKN